MQRTPFPLPVCPPPYSQGSKASPGGAGEANQQRNFSAKLYKDFWDFSVDKASQLLEQKDPDYWEKKGEQLALALFHAAAEHVPAYKDFLKKHKIKPDKIKTIADFKKLRLVDNRAVLSLSSWLTPDYDSAEQKISASRKLKNSPPPTIQSYSNS